MNLYRSFGNLMEAWVTESTPDQDWLERGEDDPPSPPSDADTNVRSESVDSGVETASSDSSFPTASASADLDPFTPISQSPVLSLPAPSSSSSSSPYLMPNRSKVEQALCRIESVREKKQGDAGDEVVRRRPLASLLPKRHASDLVRGHRTDSYGLRVAPSPSLLIRQMSEQRRPHSAIYERQISDTFPQVFYGASKSELSPGLQYLEQVCQMLEEYARDQLHLNSQTEAVRETLEEEEQAPDGCQNVEKEAPSCRRLENPQGELYSSVPPQRREKSYGHFRQRSASDTNLASLHLRRLKVDYRDHNLSSNDLMETAEEEQENQESQKDGLNKSKNYWRLKFGPFRKEDSAKSQTLLIHGVWLWRWQSATDAVGLT